MCTDPCTCPGKTSYHHWQARPHVACGSQVPRVDVKTLCVDLSSPHKAEQHCCVTVSPLRSVLMFFAPSPDLAQMGPGSRTPVRETRQMPFSP
jgi:hypothetical protein